MSLSNVSSSRLSASALLQWINSILQTSQSTEQLDFLKDNQNVQILQNQIPLYDKRKWFDRTDINIPEYTNYICSINAQKTLLQKGPMYISRNVDFNVESYIYEPPSTIKHPTWIETHSFPKNLLISLSTFFVWAIFVVLLHGKEKYTKFDIGIYFFVGLFVCFINIGNLIEKTNYEDELDKKTTTNNLVLGVATISMAITFLFLFTKYKVPLFSRFLVAGFIVCILSLAISPSQKTSYSVYISLHIQIWMLNVAVGLLIIAIYQFLKVWLRQEELP